MPHFGEPTPEGPGKRRFCRITTGQYTGDGTVSQPITGVGFPPKFVKIWVRKTVVVAECSRMFEKVDTMSGTICQIHHCVAGAEHQARDNALISLDADGFTVGDAGADDDPNKLGETYCYMALG